MRTYMSFRAAVLLPAAAQPAADSCLPVREQQA